MIVSLTAADLVSAVVAEADTLLIYGDCLDALPALAPQSIDAIICDPPYGTTACPWDTVIPFASMWDAIRRVLRPHGACVLFGSQPFTSALVMSNPEWFKYEWVWDKGRGFDPQLANRRPMKSHENICVFSAAAETYYPQKTPLNHADRRNDRGKSPNKKDGGGHQLLSGLSLPADGRVYTDRFPTSIVYAMPVPQTKRIHDTEKPRAILEYLVRTYTAPGDTVLDFTMGSGTTGHACVNLGRRFIGIERDPQYFAIARERIADAADPLRHMMPEENAE